MVVEDHSRPLVMTTSHEPAVQLLASLVSPRLDPRAVPADSWADVTRLAIEHGLDSMLLWTVREAAFSGIPAAEMSRLQQSARQTALAYVLLERAQRAVNNALAGAGIPALWLKGATLARSVYPQPTLRPMSDLDVLVPYDQREAALSVVQGIGFDFTVLKGFRARSSGDALSLKLTPHHYHLKGGIAGQVALELHSRLLGNDDAVLSLERLAWFQGQRQRLTWEDGAEFEALAPEAHLLYLCAHALLQHGEVEFYLLRYFDLHRLISGSELNWDLVVGQAAALGWTYAVERALRHTVDYFATPVPAGVFDGLIARRPEWEDVLRVKRLGEPGYRWELVRSRLATLSLRDNLRLIPLILFPAPSYMRQRYQIKAGRPTWPYYAYRWFDQGRDVMWAIRNRLTRRFG